jgi:Family of unknown function (DUF6498)
VITPPRDTALYGIAASNVLAMVVALVLRWDVRELLWPYFIQSVVIGFYSRRRMLALRDFSTEGFSSGNVPLQPTVETQKTTANFFTLHYGFFHFVYFVFLYQGSMNSEQPLTQLDGLMYVVVGLAFLLSHGRSHREHVEADLASSPNLGALMFMPYLRVIPMHLVILFGAARGGGAGTVILFSVLKTLADVGMHKFEHRRLQKGWEVTE